MDYERLKDTLKYALPMHVKERFYTGTVLPSLLFHNGFSNFYRFLEAIPGFPEEVNERGGTQSVCLISRERTIDGGPSYGKEFQDEN